MAFSSRVTTLVVRTMVISNFYQNRALHACQARIHTVSTVLLKSVRFFITDILSCKTSFEEKELAKLSCLNDSETQERRLWEVKIEENFPLRHGPRSPKSLRLRRSFRKSVSILILDPRLLRVFVLVSL